MKKYFLLFLFLSSAFLIHAQTNGQGANGQNATASVKQVTSTASNFWVSQSGQNVILSAATPPTSNMMVDVYDAAGRLVMRTNWDRYQTTKQLGVVGYGGGLYIIKLCENNIYHVIKWMKN